MVGRSSGGHYLLQNGCSVGAIESASKFDSGGEITAKIRTAFNLIDVSCQTFSLVHKLIDYAFDAAIPIAHGNPIMLATAATVAAACVVLPSQVATVPRNQHLSSKP